MSASRPSDDPAIVLAPILAADLAEHCLRAAGPGRVRLVGAELASLKPVLLSAGCEVELSTEASPDEWPADIVMVWAGMPAQREAALDLSASMLVLAGASELAAELSAWVEQAAACGWQRHTATFTLHPAPEELTVLLLAREGVDARSAQSVLNASWHGLAATLVRPGDAVLAIDAAQDEVWRIVQEQSRCSWLGVVSDMPPPPMLRAGVKWIDRSIWARAQRSVDVVITAAVLGLDSEEWQLASASKALARTGRLVILATLQPGCDPEVSALLAALEHAGLVVDRAWFQHPSRPIGVEQFMEATRDASGRIVISSDLLSTASTLVVMAVKINGAGVPRDPEMLAPNIVAFQRDYIDASIVRLIVAMGLRLESTATRRKLARDILAECPADSADYGAALCVLLYDPVALEGHRRRELLDAAEHYLKIPTANPTALRWQVSLAFVAASLYQAEGDLVSAAVLYEKVLDFDVLKFSPLLGTKTTAASLRLGWIHFGKGRLALARQAWLRGLDEARRLAAHPDWAQVVGDVESPETFAMPEFAAVMDEAGCIASALRLTSEAPLRPGLAWQWAGRSWQRQLAEARADQQRQEGWLERLQNAKDWLDGQYHNQTAELARREESIRELEEAKQALSADNLGMRAAFRLAHQRANSERSALQQQIHIAQVAHQQQLEAIEALASEHERQSANHARQSAELVQLTFDHEELIAAYERQSAAMVQQAAAQQHLIVAAQELSVRAGMLMGGAPRDRIIAESIAEEMSRLSIALDRLPLKGLVRILIRVSTAVLGRK